MDITAVNATFTDFQSRGNVVQPMGRGWEYVEAANLPGNAARWGEEASAKLGAKPVEVGRYDLVLDPGNMWLTIHESVGHPTELDRAMGYEANYAGTSFVAPPEKMLGQLKYGPAMMNIQGDRSQEGGLSTIGWDLGRFGIQFVASPRHADGMYVTGPVSEHMRIALMKTWEAIPQPKILIAAGACAINGGPFQGHPEVHDGVDKFLPVDLYIPGCPPHPLTILDGLLRLLGRR